MKIDQLRIGICGISLSICVAINAVPAKPGLISMKQPDGTELNVKLFGDENFHFYLSEDNYLLVEEASAFYYADTDSNGIIRKSDFMAVPAHLRSHEAQTFLNKVNMNNVFNDLNRLSANAIQSKHAIEQHITPPHQFGPGLFENTSFPSKGEQKGLVVLVQYADVSFTLQNPLDYFTKMVNEEGFNDYGGTGSARDYYLECSGGQFSPTFDVYGPITLPNDREYYGGNNESGKDLNPAMMALEACTQLDATVDFTKYDRDGDGYIDNVFLFYAGEGEAAGGGADTVWPHSWTLEAATGSTPVFDGVKLNRYACTNEWQKNRPDGVGTFIHEFSHVMGLPDLYATSYTGAFTPGAWSTMDHGSYNNNGCTPPLFSVFERYALGWITPQQIYEPKSAKLNSISSNEAFIIKTAKENEFYLLENRQRESWDKYIPGHGMLIWHIDYSPSVWAANKVNNTPEHQYVDIEEADGTQDDESRSGDAFPGSKGVTSFTDDTAPSMMTWTGYRLNLPITDISENDGVISFNVAGGRPEVTPAEILPAKDITPTGFIASWTLSPQAVSYLLSVYKESSDESREYILDHKDVGNLSEYDVVGLMPETEYHYFVTVVDFVGPCTDSGTESLTTLPMSFEYARPIAHEAREIYRDSFIAVWEALAEADNYYLNVYTKAEAEAETDICDFTGGLEALPDGWTTNVTGIDGRASYSGKATPSLRMSADGAYINSPEYEADIVSISFWHRGSNTPDDCTIKVMALTGASWAEVASVAIVNQAGGATTTISEIPCGTRSIKLIFNRPSSGTVAVDDIEVRWNMSYDNMAIADYTDLQTGNVTEWKVSGLNPLTEYYYTVTASSGSAKSLVSNEIKVSTSDISSIGNINLSKSATISVEGYNVTVETYDATNISIYDISGRLIASAKGQRHVFTLPSCGVYIVKVNDLMANKLVIR